MTTGRLAYEPALDGVRALAVALVLVFHADLGVFTGGYVGVSVFFTLSGYLITRLLVIEHRSTGRISIVEFVDRRIRRLFPASMLCLVGVIVAARLGWFAEDLDLRRDVIGAALQVQNWVQLAGGDSYRELLEGGVGRASPLEHYWSLAIEEQFYWLWPVAAVVAFGWRSGTVRRRALWAGFVVAAALAPVIAATWGPDAAYLATPARLSELLAGAVLAVFVDDRARRDRPLGVRAAAGFTTVAIVAIVMVALLAPADGGPLFHGAFPVFSLASVLLILGTTTATPISRAMGARWLVAIGRVSYGLYLFHWPVYVVLDPVRTGLGDAELFVVRIVVTAALTIASYHLVERPVRRSRGRGRRTVLAGAGASVAVAAVAVLSVPGPSTYWSEGEEFVIPQAVDDAPGDRPPPTSPPPSIAPSSPSSPSSPVTSAPAADPVVPETGAPDDEPGARTSLVEPVVLAPGTPLRVLLLGDSTAISMWPGFRDWSDRDPEVVAGLAGVPGLTLVRASFDPPGTASEFLDRSARFLDAELDDVLDRFRPHVVVVMIGLLDVEARVWDPAEGPLPLTDPRASSRVAAAYREVLDTLEPAGARVLLVRGPPMYSFWSDDVVEARRDTPDRDAYESIQHLLADESGRVAVLDLRAHLDDAGATMDRAARPDGMHWSEAAAVEIVEEWFATAIRHAVGLDVTGSP